MNDKPNFDTDENTLPDENAVDSFFASLETTSEQGRVTSRKHDNGTNDGFVSEELTSGVFVTSPQALARYLATEIKPQAERQLDLTVESPRETSIKLQRLAQRHQRPQRSGLNWRMPLFLYIATWVSVFWTGMFVWESAASGLLFAICVMTILTCHELGHYFQTRRYRVSASLPYFIPLPIIGLFGTMGAIIRMDGRIPNRRVLFDIGISGPLAGLVPTLICCVIGVMQAQVAPRVGGTLEFGDPLLLTWLSNQIFGPIPDEMTLLLTPVGMAGWFGLFLTTLNLFPIGQLDGGHVFYAILGKRAPIISVLLYVFIIAYVIVSKSYFWILILVLLYKMNPRHPPTSDDEPPIGVFRTILGCATLAFIVVGFTLNPLTEVPPDPSNTYFLVQHWLEMSCLI